MDKVAIQLINQIAVFSIFGMDLSDEIVLDYSEDDHEILEISGDNNAKALTVAEVYGSPGYSRSHMDDDLEDLGRLGNPNIYDDGRYDSDNGHRCESEINESESDKDTDHETTTPTTTTSNSEILAQLRANNKLLKQLRKRLQKTEKTVQSLKDKMGEKGKSKASKRVKAPLKIQVNYVTLPSSYIASYSYIYVKL